MASAKKDLIQVDLNEKAIEILRRAEEKSDEHAFMFITAFKRYQEQVVHMAELEKVIKDKGVLVKKEYVKGRENLYVNPAINAYNATSACADRTAQLIMKFILEPLRDENDEGGDAFDIF